MPQSDAPVSSLLRPCRLQFSLRLYHYGVDIYIQVIRRHYLFGVRKNYDIRHLAYVNNQSATGPCQSSAEFLAKYSAVTTVLYIQSLSIWQESSVRPKMTGPERYTLEECASDLAENIHFFFFFPIQIKNPTLLIALTWPLLLISSS